MVEEKLKEWVRQKLDEGVDEDRLRKVVEEEGYDSSIVDEAKPDVANTSPEPKQERFQAESPVSRDEYDSTEPGDKSESETDSKMPSMPEVSASMPETPDIDPEIDVPWGSLKKAGVASLAVVFILSGVFLLKDPAAEFASSIDNPIDSSSEKSPQEAERSQDTPDNVRIVLAQGEASPSRPSISPDQNVVFVNNQGQDLTVEFESGRSFDLKAGAKKEMDVNSVSYYTATSDDLTIRGSISVSG